MAVDAVSPETKTLYTRRKFLLALGTLSGMLFSPAAVNFLFPPTENQPPLPSPEPVTATPKPKISPTPTVTETPRPVVTNLLQLESKFHPEAKFQNYPEYLKTARALYPESQIGLEEIFAIVETERLPKDSLKGTSGEVSAQQILPDTVELAIRAAKARTSGRPDLLKKIQSVTSGETNNFAAILYLLQMENLVKDHVRQTGWNLDNDVLFGLTAFGYHKGDNFLNTLFSSVPKTPTSWADFAAVIRSWGANSANISGFAIFDHDPNNDKIAYIRSDYMDLYVGRALLNREINVVLTKLSRSGTITDLPIDFPYVRRNKIDTLIAAKKGLGYEPKMTAELFKDFEDFVQEEFKKLPKPTPTATPPAAAKK